MMMSLISLALLLVLLLLLGASAQQQQQNADSSQQQQQQQQQLLQQNVDFVIIGCGTAGSVLANRLSATSKVTVLEQGEDQSHSIYTQPLLYGEFYPYTGKQRHARYPWTSGTPATYNYILPQLAGGASSINGGVFQRPPITDLAGWNSSLWTFNATINDWKSIETYLDGGDPAVHGYSGPVTVQTFELDNVLSMINNSLISTLGLPYNNDSNSGISGGVSKFARNIAVVNGKAVRHDMYTRWVVPVLSRKNLSVVFGATVTTIDFNKNGKHTVNYVVQGVSYSVKAKYEVIIALDAIGAPKLLQLSGYGDCNLLASFGISCYYNNTNVGNVIESILTTLSFVGPAPTVTKNGSVLTAQYKTPGYPGVGNNIEIATSSAPVAPGLYGYLWTILQHGVSHGNVSIRDTNPFSDAIINLTFYESNASAVFDLVDAFKKVRAVMDAVGIFVEQFPGRTYTPGGTAIPTTATDSQIASFLLKTSIVDYHALGTCAIGKVVDERLRLIGVPGVRIVGTSVIPKTLTAHATCASATLIGAVCSRFIAEDWSLS